MQENFWYSISVKRLRSWEASQGKANPLGYAILCSLYDYSLDYAGLPDNPKQVATLLGFTLRQVELCWTFFRDRCELLDSGRIIPVEVSEALLKLKNKSEERKIAGKSGGVSSGIKRLREAKIKQKLKWIPKTGKVKTHVNLHVNFTPVLNEISSLQEADLKQKRSSTNLPDAQNFSQFQRAESENSCNFTNGLHKVSEPVLNRINSLQEADLKQKRSKNKEYNTIVPSDSSDNKWVEEEGDLRAHEADNSSGQKATASPPFSPPFDSFSSGPDPNGPEPEEKLLGDVIQKMFPMEPPTSRAQVVSGCWKLGLRAADVESWPQWLAGMYPHKMPSLYALKDSLGEYAQHKNNSPWEQPAFRFTAFCCGHTPSQPLTAAKLREIQSTARWLAENRAQRMSLDAWKSQNWTPDKFKAFWRSLDQSGYPSPASVLKYFDAFTEWVSQDQPEPLLDSGAQVINTQGEMQHGTA